MAHLFRFWLVVVLLAGPGCIVIVQENEDCIGHPRQVMPLEDVDLTVGKVVEKDLEAPTSPVFIHTEAHRLSYDVIVEEPGVAEVTVERGRMRVKGRAAGVTAVTIEVYEAGCPEVVRGHLTVRVQAAGAA